jgi:ATP-dependent Clp protease adapter protein ClpS
MKLRLHHEVAWALDEARARARRSRHAEVTLEHVVRVLLGFDAHWRGVLPLPSLRQELASLVARELSALPMTSGYRDADASVPFSSALEATLAEAKRGFFLPRSVGVEELLDVFLDVPDIARLVANARLDLDVVEVTMSDATQLALERRHLAVHAEHVFRVLVEERWFARVLLDAGADTDAVRLRLDEKLATLATVTKRDEVFPTKDLGVLLARVETHAWLLERPATSDVFVALALREPGAVPIVADLGAPPMALFSSLVHGVARDELASSRDGGSAQVVFHNDDYTIFELVGDLLRTEFGLTPERANELTRHVHRHGSAEVGTYAVPDARMRAEAATARARKAGFPLRIELRPIRDDDEAQGEDAQRLGHGER